MTPIRRLTSALLVLCGLALAGCDKAPDEAAAREVLNSAAGRRPEAAGDRGRRASGASAAARCPRPPTVRRGASSISTPS